MRIMLLGYNLAKRTERVALQCGLHRALLHYHALLLKRGRAESAKSLAGLWYI